MDWNWKSIRAVCVGGLIALASVEGCDGNSPPEQSGTQRLSGRDFDHLFFWNQQTPAFTRQTTASSGGSQDFWVWPDGENAPLLALSQVDWSPPSQDPRIIAGDLLMTGVADRVYDLQARSAVDLKTIAARAADGGLDWASIRRDGGGVIGHVQTGELFAGRGATFTFVPAPYDSWAADFMGNDLLVLASPSSSEAATSRLYRMALPSADLSPLPVPAFPTSIPRCLEFGIPPCATFRVLGCNAGDTACAETGRAPCAILYARANGPTDPLLKPYFFDVNTGQETALPGIDPSEFVISPDRHSAAWTHVDAEGMSSAAQSPTQTPIYVHNFCSGAEVQCPLLGPQQITWRRDSGQLFVDVADRQLSLVDVSSGTCSPLGYGTIGQYAASPAGDRLAWIMPYNPVEPPQLWVGDAAGGGARMVANDVVAFSFSPDGQALFITRASELQVSLSWLSLAADSPVEQPIADAFSGATLRGNQRVLVIDHWNTQDGSGNLDLVDLATGAHQVLAHAVTELAGSGSVDGAARVMYAVRGRFASAQDGLWQTTLPAP